MLLPHAAAAPTLGDIKARLDAALDRAGYAERSYWPTPGGFAVLTRIERITADGAPAQHDRFNVAMTEEDLRPYNLRTYVKALLTANPGYYRILAFVVTNQIVTQATSEAPATVLSEWVDTGPDSLPESISRQSYNVRMNYHCTALIYEYRLSNASTKVAEVRRSAVTGLTHLQKAGIWSALSR